MTPLVAVWINHEKAVLAFVRGEHVDTRTIRSGVHAHPHWAGAQDGGGEKKYEERHAQELARFYGEVLDGLQDAESLIFLGPGEAKIELKRRLERVKHLAHVPLKIETSDRLTDAQIVARARDEAASARRSS